MYIPSAFKVHPALALAFAGARGFGLFVACDGGRPVAATLPFRLIEADGKSPRVAFHVARGNPLAALAAKGRRTGCSRCRAPTPMSRPIGMRAAIRCRPGFMRPCN